MTAGESGAESFAFSNQFCREMPRQCEHIHAPTLSFSIIANTVFGIKHLQFSKVFWDYTSGGGASEKSPSSAGELPSNSAEGDHTENSVSPSQNSDRRPIRQANFLSASAKHRAQGKQARAFHQK